MKIKYNPNFAKYIQEKSNVLMEDKLNNGLTSAKEACPVATGRLRDNIEASYNPNTGEGRLFNTLDYAIFVNLNNVPYLEIGLFDIR